MIALSPESVLSRSDRLSWRVLEGEVVVLFPDAGTLHRLNPTGTRCWELVDGRRTLAELGEELSAEYSASAAEIVSDLEVLATDLVAAGLAEVHG
jgi:hypothetical protein